ncbi:uncharacterized protein A4U43_C06F16160 [Asparagus officinalis]|uniref:t-SNARE coiled-coil homology domain-containing protein n=1 Tax=Asparagus officinalis TaxID=4686 RepID=A0A5P1EMA4_ASPOF|nr:uncharacterized protein A4U43_C06F16160 [Asparagus officinalis]
MRKTLLGTKLLLFLMSYPLHSIEDEKNSLGNKVAVISDELSTERDRVLRISADFDTFRKRTKRDRLSKRIVLVLFIHICAKLPISQQICFSIRFGGEGTRYLALKMQCNMSVMFNQPCIIC